MKRLLAEPSYDIQRVENIGVGSPESRLWLIGEALRSNQSPSCLPFEERSVSGRMLRPLLNHLKLRRTDFYITNCVPVVPPDGSKIRELANCYKMELWNRLLKYRPLIIVALGSTAKYSLMPHPAFPLLDFRHEIIYQLHPHFASRFRTQPAPNKLYKTILEQWTATNNMILERVKQLL